ncbi:hypothetical protein Syun_008898 [Stephania yunnanensis]|uniref:Nucleolar complex protein 3 homolog n=1 Tax=Stephania yunnanensis TaxID=152371 RepID=A0AAP0KFE4_9MAGN
MGKKKKNKVILPPELPPEIADKDVEVSDEDLEFVEENRKYARFLKALDTKSITKHVTRVAGQKDDAVEELYEKRNKKKSVEKDRDEEDGVEIDPVDALPVKSLDGKLYYRIGKPQSAGSTREGEEDADENEDDGVHGSVVKLTKPEKKAKLKKIRKEEKRKAKEHVEVQPEEHEVQPSHQAKVLAEMKEELSAEEMSTRKKGRLAELGMALLADPEKDIKSLHEMLQISKDEDPDIVKLGLLSLLAVFKDIIPGYRIRLPTEKEREMTVSKAVKKMRYHESMLLSSYKAYLQKLIVLEKQALFHHVSVRCMCTLLEAVPHFNFRDNLLAAVVRNISSTDDSIRKQCCAAIKSIFANEGKHRGEATVGAVKLIADLVKTHNCQLHPDSVEVFLCLSFDEDLGKPESSRDQKQDKMDKRKRKKKFDETNKSEENDRKKSRKQLLAKTREEVSADLKAASVAPDVSERRSIQSETLSAVFETYFRILKGAMEPAEMRPGVNTSNSHVRVGAHPLLAPCLNGLGKFSHLIDLDFMGDLMKCLKTLASCVGDSDAPPENCLTVSERLRCCIVAFKIMRNNLDALNVDLQEFYVQLYNLLLEYRPDRDQGDVLAEALKIMLCEGRQHDMQRAAAFIKRLATSCLSLGSAETMAALVTLRSMLQKNMKCRNLLENDVGGGSVSGSVAKYQPFASDPNQSGALASVLWELSLLSKHYHPTISSAAAGIASMSTTPNQVYMAMTSPQQAFIDLSLEKESFDPKSNLGASIRKRKKTGKSSLPPSNEPSQYSKDEEGLKVRFTEHFDMLRDITENERLRRELNRVESSLRLYDEYKEVKKKKLEGPKTKTRKKTARLPES